MKLTPTLVYDYIFSSQTIVVLTPSYQPAASVTLSTGHKGEWTGRKKGLRRRLLNPP